MKNIRLMFACSLLLLVEDVSQAALDKDLAARLGETVTTLRALSSNRVGPWRFQWPAQDGGQAIDIDDSKWPQVWPEHTWNKPDSAAWYRMIVKVPKRVGLAPVPGGPLVLELAIDDDGEIYVDGELRQKFHWDQGRVVLTEDARPGQQFLVAVKAINDPVHGRLMWARLRYAKLDPVREDLAAHADRLQFAQELLSTEPDARIDGDRAVGQSLEALEWSAMVEDPRAAQVSLKASTQALAPLAPLARKFTLHLVGHAHIDMNWLWLWPETIKICRDTWTQVVAFFNEFPEFRFSESQPAAYRALEEDSPHLFAQMQRYVKEGRWDPTCGTWVQGDTNLASGEALCRQLLTAREYMMAKFGRWTKMAWMPDNFGHAWTVPTIFRDAGLEWYYFARCGPGSPLFWWEGPDGSRLAAYNYGGYGWRIESGVIRVPLDVKRRVGVRHAMLAYGVGDHGGGPTRQDVQTALRLQREPMAPEVKFSRTDEFFEAALKDKPELPVVKKELNFTFRGCYTTHADMKRRNRQLENLLPTAEAAAAAAWLLAGRQYAASAFLEAWRNVCFNQFHDLLPGSAIHDSYKYCHELYDKAEAAARAELDASLRALGERVDTRGDGMPVIVWNRLAWDRPGLVRVWVPWVPSGTVMAVGPKGVKRPARVLARAENGSAEVEFLGQAPALGWAIWHLKPTQSPLPWGSTAREGHDAITLENSGLRVIIDRVCGGLRSVRDLETGREMVPPGDRAGRLQIIWEEPHKMSAWEIGQARWTRPLDRADEVAIEQPGGEKAPAVVRVVHSFGDSLFTQRISLGNMPLCVEFDLQAKWQEKGNNTDGSPMLKVAFPLRLLNPVFTCEIPFGSVQRPLDGEDVPAQQWADLTEVKLRRAEGAQPVAVDLEPHFNQDIFATGEQPADGDFDGLGMSFPAEMMEGSRNGLLEWQGLPWRVPPTGLGAKNAVACVGQTLPMPAADAASLAIFGAAGPGDHSGRGWLTFADGSRQLIDIGFSDWCYGPQADEAIVLRHPYRYRPEGKVSPEPRLFVRTYDLPEGKRLRSVVLPDLDRVRIVAISLGPRVEPDPVFGASLLNDCKYGHDALGSTLRLTLLRASYEPDPEPDQGEHRIRYSLLLHEGSWQSGSTLRRAWELNSPLVALAVEAHEGNLTATSSLLSLEPSTLRAQQRPGQTEATNLVVSAFKGAEDGRGLIVRWYESEGRETMTALRTGFEVAGAELTNVVEGETRGKLQLQDSRTVLVKTPAHSVVTVRLIPAR